jgi:hypothetical protein
LHNLLQSSAKSANAHAECFQQLTVAGCAFSMLHCLLASVAEGLPHLEAPAAAGPAVRTADFVEVLNVEGNYRRAMELMVRFDVALAHAGRRLDAQMIEAFLEDFNQPSDPADGTQLSEHAFLCALLLACPSEPTALALPLSVLRTILSSLPTSAGSAPATSAVIPPPCVQLLVARATVRQRTLPAARAIAEKMCTWRGSPAEQEGSFTPACAYYVSGAVALYMHAHAADKPIMAGSLLRPSMTAVQHHCSPQWAPVLSCFAALEQMMPARCVVDYPQRQLTPAVVDMVQCMSRCCSGDAVRSFAAVAVAAWWLLESSARQHVSAVLLARLCEQDARITSAMADALHIIHATSDSPIEQLLVAQPATLRQISNKLVERPNVRRFPASA